MWRTLAVAVSVVAIGCAAQAQEVEIGLTDETIQGTYYTHGGLVGLEGTDVGLGLLLSDDRDIVASGSLMVPGVLDNFTPGPLTISVGGKALAGLLSDPNDDIFALAPGAQARFALPLGTPMAVVANLFYSPDIITFGDADDVLDFNVRYEIGFLENFTAFVGFRWLTFDREGGGEDDIVENLQAGLRFGF